MRFYDRTGGRLDPSDIGRILRDAAASNRMEGLVNTEAEMDMLRRGLSGEITRAAYMDWLMSRAGVEI